MSTSFDSRERMLEARVSNAQRNVDRAKAEHGEALRDLRRYRKDKAKLAAEGEPAK